MTKQDLNKFATIYRTMTGSNMRNEDMLNSFNSMDSETSHRCFQKVDELVKERNQPIDQALPVITAELNIIGTEESFDPSVLLMNYVANIKK